MGNYYPRFSENDITSWSGVGFTQLELELGVLDPES